MNHALSGVGGGLDLYGSHAPFNKPINSFYIYNCSFISNAARYGTSIAISKEYYESIVQGNLFTTIIDNCTFIYKAIKTFHSPASKVGTVSTFGVDNRFRNFTQFNANRETALVVEGASVEFYNISETIIILGKQRGAWWSYFPNWRLMDKSISL